jgi:pilus assembly protein CpaB
VEVYVAHDLVPAGTTLQDAISQDLITRELVSAKGVPAGSLTSVSASDDSSVAVSDIQPGELVLASRFGAQAAATSPLPIPDGDVAVSLALQDPAHVGSFVTPGSQIAIFDTFNARGTVAGANVPSGDHLADDFSKVRATRVLLPKVEVLAVGSTSAPSSQTGAQNGAQANGSQANGNQTAQTTTLFTVAVDQADAEALVQGVQTGTLYFALLNGSSKIAAGPGVSDLNLFSAR